MISIKDAIENFHLGTLVMPSWYYRWNSCGEFITKTWCLFSDTAMMIQLWQSSTSTWLGGAWRRTCQVVTKFYCKFWNGHRYNFHWTLTVQIQFIIYLGSVVLKELEKPLSPKFCFSFFWTKNCCTFQSMLSLRSNTLIFSFLTKEGWWIYLNWHSLSAEENPKILTWKERLQIAVDAAQGSKFYF